MLQLNLYNIKILSFGIERIGQNNESIQSCKLKTAVLSNVLDLFVLLIWQT